MKTKTVTSAKKSDYQINIIGLYVNISRMYEVCKVGNHSISFCYYSSPEDKERSVNIEDIKMIADFYNLGTSLNGDILCEVVRPDFGSIEYSMTRNHETLEEINERIEKAIAFETPELNTLNPACMSLLKHAYDRMNFSVSNIKLILSIAQTIARLAYSSIIKIEHVAEAIQYRALRDDETVKIYQ